MAEQSDAVKKPNGHVIMGEYVMSFDEFLHKHNGQTYNEIVELYTGTTWPMRNGDDFLMYMIYKTSVLEKLVQTLAIRISQ